MPTATLNPADQRKNDAIDQFRDRLRAAAPQTIDKASWTFGCTNDDWTFGYAVWRCPGGYIEVGYTAVSDRWCVEANYGGHTVLLLSEVPDHDAGRAIAKAARAINDAKLAAAHASGTH